MIDKKNEVQFCKDCKEDQIYKDSYFILSECLYCGSTDLDFRKLENVL